MDVAATRPFWFSLVCESCLNEVVGSMRNRCRLDGHGTIIAHRYASSVERDLVLSERYGMCACVCDLV